MSAYLLEVDYVLNHGKEVEGIIRKLGSVGGLILVGATEGNRVFYISEWGTIRFFGDETKMEEPKTWQTIRGVIKAMAKFEDVAPAIWVHPDAHNVPLEKYLQMSGIQYQGCPRQ